MGGCDGGSNLDLRVQMSNFHSLSLTLCCHEFVVVVVVVVRRSDVYAFVV